MAYAGLRSASGRGSRSGPRRRRDLHVPRRLYLDPLRDELAMWTPGNVEALARRTVEEPGWPKMNLAGQTPQAASEAAGVCLTEKCSGPA